MGAKIQNEDVKSESELVALGANKTKLINDTKIYVSSGSILKTLAQAITDGNIIGSTDIRTLTNKTFDDELRLKELSTPATPSSGYMKVYPKSDKSIYVLDSNGVEKKVGSGVGDVSMYGFLNSEDDSGSWATGNGTFLSGGSFAATFTQKNTSSSIHGTSDYKIVLAAGSTNDYAASPIQSVPLRSRAKTNSIKIQYKYDGANTDVKHIAYDVTNAVILTSELAYLTNTADVKTAIITHFVPSNCTQIRYGVICVAANAGKILQIDDIEFSDSPFVYKNLLVQACLTLSIQSITTDANAYLPLTALVPKGDASLYTINTTTRRITFNATAIVTAHVIINDGTADAGAPMFFNSAGTLLTYGQTAFPAGNWGNAGATYMVSPGDYLVLSAGQASATIDYARANVTITAQSEYVVTPANSIKQYDLTVTGTNWTTQKAVGIPYRDRNNVPRLKFNIYGDFSVSAADLTLYISNTVSGTGYQALSANSTTGSVYGGLRAYCYGGDGTQFRIELDQRSDAATALDWFISGDVELRLWPTWADNVSSNYMAAIPVSPICAIYETNSEQAIAVGTPEIIDYDDKVIDTHNAVTVGASWKFTAPQAGYYHYEFTIQMNGQSGNPYCLFEVRKGASTVISKTVGYLNAEEGSNVGHWLASGATYLTKGEYIYPYLTLADHNVIIGDNVAEQRACIYLLGIREV